ncbi:MAG: tRNA preQ1(34) S-adenosylmethionine ribosyltransferase-isomerase QueA [Planctomycetota bacterium]|jgi:S-adenosylmethionine:tRNA ribosyltransferase-isomerase
METHDLDYDLPPENIAQAPAPKREDARLLAVDRSTRALRHLTVRDFPSLLRPGDLVVLNDTLVVSARLHAKRPTGGQVRLLLLAVPDTGPAPALAKSSGRLQAGELLELVGGEDRLRVTEAKTSGILTVEPEGGNPWSTVLERSGRPPLPPYIRRPFDPDPRLAEDHRRYQTVYAKHPGSIAAPTAGLHLTPALIGEAQEAGAHMAWVTLHIGVGTFKPVKTDRLEDHEMESEWCTVPPETAQAVADAKAEGRRVVAVGTTVVRTLEAAAAGGELGPFRGRTDLFIRPPYRFRAVDALLTNFHLPRSTLLALVGAFVGLTALLEVYREAVRRGYRFYSYGDACFFA